MQSADGHKWYLSIKTSPTQTDDILSTISLRNTIDGTSDSFQEKMPFLIEASDGSFDLRIECIYFDSVSF